MERAERSQNGFSYESDDTKLPYIVDKYDISQRRIAVFNYSPEYFRKKESSTSGLYQVYGGNIPSDMKDSRTWQFKNSSATPPGPLVCTLNKGIATKLMQFDILNLNPNRITRYPPECNETLPPLEPIQQEVGKDQKPNHLYLPTWQPSASTHPRATGYAHEDNYDCLTSYKGLTDLLNTTTGGNWGSCCQDMINCVKGLTVYSVGNLSPEQFPYINCQVPDVIRSRTVYPVECNNAAAVNNVRCNNSSGCKGGFYMPVQSVVVGGFPYDALGTNAYRHCKTEDIAGKRKSLVEANLTVLFYGEGNQDCGCSGHYKDVKVSKIEECVECVYSTISDEGGFIFESGRSCTTVDTSSTTFCGCTYNKEYDTGGKDQATGKIEKVWVSSFSNPTFRFPNWKPVIINNEGKLVSDECSGKQLMDCTAIR
jgi:hypothetical protein